MKTEMAHLEHLRISVKSHPMLKKINGETMLMPKDETNWEETVRRTNTIDRTHYQKLW